jgi:hypothetical protein
MALMEAAARAGVAGAVALGPEHDARRRVRALHRTRAARRAAGSVGAAPVHDAEEASHARTWAIVERELRRFRRSPMLIVMSMIFPLVQLVVLGYAFGGNVKHLKVAIVDQDHGVPAVKVRELARRRPPARARSTLIDYADQGQALTDLRNGRVNGVLTIPPEFSRACSQERAARGADRGQHRQLRLGALAGTLGGCSPPTTSRRRQRASRPGRARRRRGLSVRAVRAVPAARDRS